MTTAALPTTDRLPSVGIHDLSGEHAELMRNVTRRVAPVLALLGARTWPHGELGVLTNFLRTAVLRQVSDEEVYLFPHDSSAPPFAELSHDHVRLHTLIAELERLHAAPGSRSELHAVLDDLLGTMSRHLAAEEAVLAALRDTDADGPVLLTPDLLPLAQAAEWSIERLLRLRPGETAEVRSRHGWLLDGICAWLHQFDPVRFGLELCIAEGGDLLRVSCRPTDDE